MDAGCGSGAVDSGAPEPQPDAGSEQLVRAQARARGMVDREPLRRAMDQIALDEGPEPSRQCPFILSLAARDEFRGSGRGQAGRVELPTRGGGAGRGRLAGIAFGAREVVEPGLEQGRRGVEGEASDRTEVGRQLDALAGRRSGVLDDTGSGNRVEG